MLVYGPCKVHQSGADQRRKHYAARFKAVNQVTSDTEISPFQVTEWQDLEPTLPGGLSPEIERTLDRINASFPVGPPPAKESIGEILAEGELAQEPAPEPAQSTPSTSLAAQTPPQSPFEEGLIEDLPVPSPEERRVYRLQLELLPAVTSETVGETEVPVVLTRHICGDTPFPSTPPLVPREVVLLHQQQPGSDPSQNSA